MKNKIKKFFLMVVGFIFVISSALPASVFGQDISFKLSVPIGGVEDVRDFGSYIALIYNYLIGVAVIVSIVMIMYGGFRWITAAGSGEKISQAKSTIVASIVGILLALFSYTLLNTINPKLLKLEMPVIPKIERQTWEKRACKVECPEGQVPVGCTCMDDIPIGGHCIVGDVTSEAQCEASCPGCACHPRVDTCLIKISKVSMAITGIVAGGALLAPAFGATGASSLSSQGLVQIGKVAVRGGWATVKFASKTAVKHPVLTIMTGITGYAAGDYAYDMVESALGKAGLVGSGMCYAESQAQTPDGGLCTKDSHCQSGKCILSTDWYQNCAFGQGGICGGGNLYSICNNDEDCNKGKCTQMGACKCVRDYEASALFSFGGAGDLKSCSNGESGSACIKDQDCQKGLICKEYPITFGGAYHKCAPLKGEGPRASCTNDVDCDKNTFKEKTGVEPPLVKCLKVEGESEGQCYGYGYEQLGEAYKSSYHGQPCFNNTHCSAGKEGKFSMFCLWSVGLGYWGLKIEDSSPYGQCKPLPAEYYSKLQSGEVSSLGPF